MSTQTAASPANPAASAPAATDKGYVARAASAATEAAAAPSPQAAQAGQATANALTEAAKNTVDAGKRGVEAAANAVSEPGKALDGAKSKVSTFFSELNVGSILGGGIGLMLAWLAGNFFGEGFMGTFLTIALAIPMMIMGSSQFGGWINDKLGRGPKVEPQQQPARSQEKAQAPSLDTPLPAELGQAKLAALRVPAPSSDVQAMPQLNEATLASLEKAAKDAGIQSPAMMLPRAANRAIIPAIVEASPSSTNQVSLERVRAEFASCQQQGHEAALGLWQVSDSGNIPCVPKGTRIVSTPVVTR